MPTKELLFCPVCGHDMEQDTCSVCGYSWDPQKTKIKHVISDAAVYRLMSAADAYFARKNYNEAYIAYNTVIEGDPHCSKAVFRINIISQYLMYETSSVYLNCDNFFRRVKDMLTIAVESKADEKLVITVCRDMLDFISYSADYERKFALSYKNRQSAFAYIKNLIELLANTHFIMKCIICVNSRESAFAAMKCYDTAAALRDKIVDGIEYYGIDESGEDADPSETHIRVREPDSNEKEQTEKIFDEICEIRRSILKNADDALYGELKALEKKASAPDKVRSSDNEILRQEHENWRKNNEKAFFSADKRNIIFGIFSKTFLVFAAVMFVIFIFVVLVYDEAVGMLIGSSAVFAALGVLFTALERHFDNRRSFYAKIIYNDDGNSKIRDNL